MKFFNLVILWNSYSLFLKVKSKLKKTYFLLFWHSCQSIYRRWWWFKWWRGWSRRFNCPSPFYPATILQQFGGSSGGCPGGVRGASSSTVSRQVWQYRLWSLKVGDAKFNILLPENVVFQRIL